MSARTPQLLVALSFALCVACQGEKAGDPCDKFFQNTCKSPLSCVDTDAKKVCAGSCEWSTETMPPHNTCKDPAMEPAEVQYMQGTTNIGGAGCYCLPGKGGAPKPSASPAASTAAPPVKPNAAPTPTPSAHPKPGAKK